MSCSCSNSWTVSKAALSHKLPWRITVDAERTIPFGAGRAWLVTSSTKSFNLMRWIIFALGSSFGDGFLDA